MKNQHLIPANIVDLIENLKASTNENERNNYILRLETIRDYCDSAVKKEGSKNMFDALRDRKAKEGKYSRIGRNNV